ncbi:hypothetical protein [Vagococcus humatus]|uniref:Uncharacterized protein n=1 Tax=Vagococcus humatus TaxID=1889241 RepID=A0A429Z7V8_9ENTE|nr:hypothetical protein [Vagococcus humatus]RST89799.1 hypothetical protein C7P63_01595 [Vagococcus humatus]
MVKHSFATPITILIVLVSLVGGFYQTASIAVAASLPSYSGVSFYEDEEQVPETPDPTPTPEEPLKDHDYLNQLRQKLPQMGEQQRFILLAIGVILVLLSVWWKHRHKNREEASDDS